MDFPKRPSVRLPIGAAVKQIRNYLGHALFTAGESGLDSFYPWYVSQVIRGSPRVPHEQQYEENDVITQTAGSKTQGEARQL